MEQQQPQQQQSGAEVASSQQRPQQEAASEEEAGNRNATAATPAASAEVVVSSRRSSAGSVSSPRKGSVGGSGVGGGGGRAGSAPSSPKRASIQSSSSSSPGSKRQSASSLASAPRVGAPLPPAPKASGGGSQHNSPRKAPARKEFDLHRSHSESSTGMVMAADEVCTAAESEHASTPQRPVREDFARSRSASVPNIASDAVAALAVSGPTSPSRGGAPHLMLAPRPQTSSHVVPASVSAQSSATSTPVPQQPRFPPSALTTSPAPMHLVPPLVTSASSASAATAVTGALSPGPSNPVSPTSALPQQQQVGAPSMPNLDQRYHHPAAAAAASVAVAQDGVLLGVEALERQQAEVEERRLRAAAEAQMAAKAEAERQRAQAQAQHLEQMQHEAQEVQHVQARGRSASVSQVPHVAGGLPPRSASTPPQAIGQGNGNGPVDEDDDTAPSSTCPPPPPADSTPNQPRRTSSFGKFLKTPLKQLRQSSFNGDVTTGASSAHKHGSDALVVPPKNVDGVLEVEGVWQEDEVKPLVYGYLRKLGRNGLWQKRWFETDGMHLRYYKSRKRSKILASLDLCHVGDIQIDITDESCCTFTIQVADRPYFLRATSEPLCKHWVINLNRVKEARLQVGGMQLVEPHFDHSGGVNGSDRQRTESDECMAPRVVMVANRSRTRAMAASETEDAMMEIMRQSEEKKADDGDIVPSRPRTGTVFGDGGVGPDAIMEGGVVPTTVASAPPSSHGQTAAVAFDAPIEDGSHPQSAENNSKRLAIAQLPPVVLARWQKRKSTLTRLSLRLLRWARSMKASTKCIGDEDVVMGSPVHPPGRPVHEFGEHDFSSQPGTQELTENSDSTQRPPGVGASRSFEGGHAEWIDKEKQVESTRMHISDADSNVMNEGVIQSVASGGSASAAAQSAATGGDGYESEEETRELS